MPGAEVTSTTVEVTHVVNGQTITLPEQVNHVGTFARIFGAGKYSELIWALLFVAFVHVLLTRRAGACTRSPSAATSTARPRRA